MMIVSRRVMARCGLLMLALAGTSSAFQVTMPAAGIVSTAAQQRHMCRAATLGTARLPVTSNRRQTASPLMSGRALDPDEDGWYDSDEWKSFGKSLAKEVGVGKEGKRGSEARGDEGQKVGEQSREQEEQRESKGGVEVEWLKLNGVDICLPKDRRRPLDGSPRFLSVVHFIGGTFVGSIPKQSYAPLLEGLASRGKSVVIATPCAALSGMDHYKAAYEAAFKFSGACSELEAELGRDVFEASSIPTIGVAHSLGCKVQVLMDCLPDAREAAGRERAANIHLAFNNYGAKQSIPVLSELAEVQRGFQDGLAQAAPFLDRVGNFAEEVKNNQNLQGILGADTSKQASQVLDFISNIGRAAANAQSSISDEFSPSPDETMRLLTADYGVSRNLVVKFLDDTIDQGVDLCLQLRSKFTDKVTGTGGRLELKRLAGSHITPNTPDLGDLVNGGSAFADQVAGSGFAGFDEFSKKKAVEVTDEIESLIDTINVFIRDEAALDLMSGGGGRKGKRLGGG